MKLATGATISAQLVWNAKAAKGARNPTLRSFRFYLGMQLALWVKGLGSSGFRTT